MVKEPYWSGNVSEGVCGAEVEAEEVSEWVESVGKGGRRER